jgi:tRNA(fMet)-specific endonuclease VapC
MDSKSMNYILDTNILIHIIRGTPNVSSQLAVLNLPNHPVSISIVTMGEMLSFAQQNRWGISKKADLELLFKTFRPITITKRALIDIYAEIDTFSQGRHPIKSLPVGKTARNMGKNDLWIAATTHLLNATLVTTDHDFDHLDPSFIQLHKIMV